MNAKQLDAAIKLSVSTALSSGKCSLPEIIGTLELAKINAERLAYNNYLAHQKEQASSIVPIPNRILPPNGASPIEPGGN